MAGEDRLCPECNARTQRVDGACERCLLQAARRDAWRSVLWLAAIWLPIGAYVAWVLVNDAIEGPWRFANAVPAVLIGLFASSFAYGGLVVGALASRRRFAALVRLRAQGW